MALQTNIDAPGGFQSADGYRRMLGINVDFNAKTILIGVGDYRDKAWRDLHPSGYVNERAYKIDAVARPEGENAYKDDAGKVQIVKVDAVPSGAAFLDQPISTYLASVTPETSLGELLGAVCYGYARTRSENANATNV